VDPKTKLVLEEALKLDAKQRELLISSLEASLDQACLEELERRVPDMVERRSRVRLSPEAMAKVRARLRAVRGRGI
jgi:hypothetical protein